MSKWDAGYFDQLRQRKAEWEQEHPELAITHVVDYELAKAWGKPATSLWVARAGGTVVAAGDGLAGILSALTELYGPTQGDLARQRKDQRRALLLRRAELTAQRDRLLAELAGADAALAGVDAEITESLAADGVTSFSELRQAQDGGEPS